MNVTVEKKFTAPMTLEERGAMEKLKDALEEDENSDYDSDIHSDNLLIRFLRARQLNIEKAALMFNNFLKFKVEYKVDTILTVIIENYSRIFNLQRNLN
jgi:hypothetical protein